MYRLLAAAEGEYAWKDVTNVHPLGLAAVGILGIAMLTLPRRWAVVPMLAMACFVSPVQKIVVAGLDFSFLRVMVLFGVLRLYMQHEHHGFVWKRIDKLIIAYAISASIILTVREATMTALVNRLGFSFDVLGMYFLFRCLIRSWRDVDAIILGCIWISIPTVLFFFLENRTGRNLFSMFGGVPAITGIREGRLRCQGPFPHSILAGCFWALLLPLMVAYGWKEARARAWAAIGAINVCFIVVFCASSTPVMSVLAAMLGGAMFRLRYYMKPVLRGLAVTLVVLHFAMNAPVWHLIARVNVVGGSTGYHRYLLIDRAISHADEWFLLGTSNTAHWGTGLQDLTNHYVLEAVRGGMLSLVLFVWLIVEGFRCVGRIWRQSAKNKYRLILAWAIGVSLFVHCINYIGVSYFGQIDVLWYLVLAMIGSLTPWGISQTALAARRSDKMRRHPRRAPSTIQ